MKNILIWTLLMFLITGTAAGCGGVAPTTGSPVQPSVIKTEPPLKVTGAGWEEKWNSVLAKSKTEGTMTMYTHWVPEARISLSQTFKEKYGITLEFTLFQSGSDMLARLQTEKQIGLKVADVIGTGATTLVTTMKPAGILGPLEPLLILPEALDPKAWRGGEFPYMDGNKMAVGMIGLIMRDINYNTNLVKEGEITSPRDLLKPQYKGKIVMHDPTIPGSGNASLSQVVNILGFDEGMEWFKQLLKNEPLMTRDYRLQLETVVREKHAIGLGSDSALLSNFLTMGAPVGIAVFKEGAQGTPSSGGLGVPVAPPHPNATTVFINWLLTREGQSALSKALQAPSRRLDASTEGVNAIFLPREGEKIYWENEESLLRKGKIMQRAKEIVTEWQK